MNKNNELTVTDSAAHKQCRGSLGTLERRCDILAQLGLQHTAASRFEKRCAAVGCKSRQHGAAGRIPALILLPADNAEGLLVKLFVHATKRVHLQRHCVLTWPVKGLLAQ